MTDERAGATTLSRGEDELNEQGLTRRYRERFTDWSEPGAVKENQDGELVDPPIESHRAELRTRIRPISRMS